jgi:DNA-binding NtrC family response regulator
MLPKIDATVLVVEDELIVRLDLSEALETAGCKVRHARSAEEALEMLYSDASIGVVFTDIKMDTENAGMHLARRIREIWPKIVVVYSSGNIPRMGHIEPDGVKLLPKPYDVTRLREVLNEIAFELE